MSTVVARIDRDYINNDGIVSSRVGFLWTAEEVNNIAFAFDDEPIDFTKVDRVRFRLLDDDENPYYGGWLFNEASCMVQQMLLRWAEHDAGCTIIEVKLNKTIEVHGHTWPTQEWNWVREIG